MPDSIIIYTDGAARGNPGPGGYGVLMMSGKHRKEISGGFRLTTNNRMELLAVIIGMETIKKEGSLVTFYTDSKYVAEAVTKGWLFQWEKKGFRKKKNSDLWRRFLVAYRRHKVNFKWVEGHAGVEGNERCDAIAVQASLNEDLPPDEGYEAEMTDNTLF